MVNGNVYLVITLVVLQGYYLSENVRQLSHYIQQMSLCHQTPSVDGYIHSNGRWHVFLFKCSV